ncbi:hypothetical protein ACFFX0_27580 [Citricoccus parietis]|uniref:Uncharacterized protein n=1 Tax=Citricoccus parietis TaxID=592307 RepID=A0ABV5G720_9MICC
MSTAPSWWVVICSRYSRAAPVRRGRMESRSSPCGARRKGTCDPLVPQNHDRQRPRPARLHRLGRLLAHDPGHRRRRHSHPWRSHRYA